ncbi:sulfate adenylyltransferase subunit CysN [Paraglaciecola psychrophila]|uniref:Sulfate adenylyltransferase subunit 1 n=1 Tax=Paraglaciecola psychrophila 170 TaxID=1129794 RepID=K7AQ14_9ALTE|nr:sulfate adenylyltransferase subunit CysN [Paraglaciecola psychrophila]AGH43991.1 sulfate adenylyltransferase large subunit [Paraglaciecola psychrophila 170]GAC37390.1 sulfate adenylyltransferase subunit 1 [Paraglaciecola psychrophila 170]
MNSENTLLQSDILGYLDQHEKKDMLRFLTCGSVDDGKSTLIGRLLHDSKMIFEDQLAAITKDSKKMGTTGDKVDLALLVDGLQSEREQGITIDVAYRYYSTDKRKFIIADTPGHEQYTRNMVTGASNCDVAIILIDARAGVKTQTRRHSFLVSLLGIKHVIVAVNKMDLKDYSETVYEEIKADYLQFSKQLEIPDIQFIPLSALDGDNVVNVSENTPWYQGETLMTMLEQVEINDDINADDFRFPVQYVNRPNLNFRGFAGTVVSGQIKPGDRITALPSGKQSRVKALVNFEGEQERVYAPLTTTITLEDEIDISRGDMIVKSDNLPLHSNTYRTNLVWMDEEPMMPNKQYGFKFATKFVPGSVTEVEYQIDVNSMEHKNTVRLALNEIAVGKIKLTQPVACDPYTKNRSTGAFIIIDRVTNGTVGAGMIIDVAEDMSAGQFSEFELEFNDLVRKHFPHWNATDIRKL